MVGYIMVGFIVGVILCVILGLVFRSKPKSVGYLNIIDSNEPGEDPYMFLYLDVPVNYIRNEKYVIFTISQK